MIEKGTALRHLLSWSHYRELVPLKNIDEINYYINTAITKNYGYRELCNRIKSHEYERLDDNTKNKLINKEESNVTDFVKNPIIIKNSLNYEDISEKNFAKINT